MSFSNKVFFLLAFSFFVFACNESSTPDTSEPSATSDPSSGAVAQPAPDLPATPPEMEKAKRLDTSIKAGDDYIGLFIENIQARVSLSSQQVNQIRSMGEKIKLNEMKPESAKIKLRGFRKSVISEVLTEEQVAQIKKAKQ